MTTYKREPLAGTDLSHYPLTQLGDTSMLPITVKILIEGMIRWGADDRDVKALAKYPSAPSEESSVPFRPARHVLAGIGNKRQQADEPQRCIVRRGRIPIVQPSADGIDQFGQRYRTNAEALQISQEALERNVVLELQSQLHPEWKTCNLRRLDRRAKPERMLSSKVLLSGLILEG